MDTDTDTDTDKAPKPGDRIPPWTTLPCEECGREGQATRAEPGEHPYVCGLCLQAQRTESAIVDPVLGILDEAGFTGAGVGFAGSRSLRDRVREVLDEVASLRAEKARLNEAVETWREGAKKDAKDLEELAASRQAREEMGNVLRALYRLLLGPESTYPATLSEAWHDLRAAVGKRDAMSVETKALAEIASLLEKDLRAVREELGKLREVTEEAHQALDEAGVVRERGAPLRDGIGKLAREVDGCRKDRNEALSELANVGAILREVGVAAHGDPVSEQLRRLLDVVYPENERPKPGERVADAVARLQAEEEDRSEGYRGCCTECGDALYCEVCRTSGQDTGRKEDAGKARWDLMPWEALDPVLAAVEHGADRYGPNNWKHVPEARRRFANAAQRHLRAWFGGEVLDPRSGLPHLAHAVSSLLFVLAHSLPAARPPEEP